MAELIQGKMIAGTKDAILMEIDGMAENIWISKKQIDCKKGFKAVFAITDWYAWVKGLMSEDEYNRRKAGYQHKQPNPRENFEQELTFEDKSEKKQSNLPF